MEEPASADGNDEMKLLFGLEAVVLAAGPEGYGL